MCRNKLTKPSVFTNVYNYHRVRFNKLESIQRQTAEGPCTFITYDTCSGPSDWGNITKPEMICAGDQDIGICFGDSGCRLACNDNGNNEYRIIGGLAVTKPSVFTRVHS